MLRRLASLFMIVAAMALPAAAQSVRIKDLVEVDGVRSNDLVGYGLVVGLNGTGDGLRNSPFTEEIMTNILERLGVNVTGEQFRPRNVAAVLVTGRLPPFARTGGQVDVTVSAKDHDLSRIRTEELQDPIQDSRRIQGVDFRPRWFRWDETTLHRPL